MWNYNTKTNYHHTLQTITLDLLQPISNKTVSAVPFPPAISNSIITTKKYISRKLHCKLIM